MIVYYCTLCIIGFMCIGVQSKKTRNKQYSFVIAAVVLTLVAGLRYQVGRDYLQYAVNYSRYVSGSLNLIRNPAIMIVAKICSLIYDDYATWFLCMSIITISLFMFAVYKYSVVPALSLILFMLVGCWHGSFNVVKQVAASSIILCGYPFLRDRKFWKWALICVAAAMFHISSVLMIPAYFLITDKVNWKRILIMIAVGIVLFLSYDLLFEIMRILKQNDEILDEESRIVTASVSILRVLVHVIPLAVCLLSVRKYKRLFRQSNDRDFLVSINILLMDAVVNVAASQSIYLTRFCAYFDAFTILAIPQLLRPLKKRNRQIITAVMLILYLIFWSYDLYKGSTTVNYQWIFER